jgi:SAM-dependent methyltransferase
MENNNANNFHKTVADYYDKDADLGFKSRAQSNPLLDKIRADFRMITIKYPFSRVLEIGCGPGFDVAWFASEFPDKDITGVDISQNMVSITNQQLSELKLENARAIQSDERGLLKQFTPGQFDLVYVYFGALNTVSNLDYAAKQIFELLSPGGHAVLTFVNKWYLREMIVQAIKLNFKTAFARLRKEWGGYSIDRHLPSRCYSPGQVVSAFKDFNLLERKGYSISFPAWYNYHKFKNQPEKIKALWEKDQKLQTTPLWSKGEYTLFVFRKPVND